MRREKPHEQEMGKKEVAHTPILLHKFSARLMPLTPLNPNRPIRIITRVNLQTLLIGKNIHPDTRTPRTQRQHAQITSLRPRISRSIKNKRIIITRAIIPAIVYCRGDVPPDLLGGSEVEESAVHGADEAGGDFDVVDLDVPRGVRHVQGMV